MPSNYIAFGSFSPPELAQFVEEYAIENQSGLIGDQLAGVSILEFIPSNVVGSCCMQCLADPSCTLWFTENGDDIDIEACVLIHNYQPTSISSPQSSGSPGGSFSAKPTGTVTGQCAGVATVAFNVQTCTTCEIFTGGVGPCGVMATSSP
jgi:hypothetical protein